MPVITDELLEELRSNTERRPSYLWISSSVADLSLKELGDLAEALESNTKVKSLHLRGFNFNAEYNPAIKGAQHLSRLIELNSTLTELDLRESIFGIEGIKTIAASLEHNTALLTLDLSWLQFGTEGTQHIAGALERNSTLKSLNLSFNLISHHASQYLTQMLRRNTALTSLDLSFNDLRSSVDCFVALEKAVEGNYTLLELKGFESTKITGYLERNRILQTYVAGLEGFYPSSHFRDVTLSKLVSKTREIINAKKKRLRSTHYLSELYRLSVSLTRLTELNVVLAIELLVRPFQHLKFQVIADKAAAQLLLKLQPTDEIKKARYQLLAYTSRHDSSSAEFATGIIGCSKPEGEAVTTAEVRSFLETPKLLPNGAYWLTYDEILKLAKLAYFRLKPQDKESLEGLFLARICQQKDYCPFTVNACFMSPQFIQEITRTHPGHASFQCLEGYLKLQHIPGLGGQYNIPGVMDNNPLPRIDEHSLARFEHAFERKQCTHPSVHEEISFLKRIWLINAGDPQECCLSPLDYFNEHGHLDDGESSALDIINGKIRTLLGWFPELNDTEKPLPETAYISESYRLMLALGHLAVHNVDGTIDRLAAPFHHPRFQTIADKIAAQVLMGLEATADTQQTRYQLLAYTSRHDLTSPALTTGIIGFNKPEGETVTTGEARSFLETPKLLPNGAYWLTYDEILTLTTRAYDALSTEDKKGQEGQFLARLSQQKDYCPITVNACFMSPQFIKALAGAHSEQASFQCLEGYLKLQYIPGLGGKYNIPGVMDNNPLPRIDEHSLTRYEHALQRKHCDYPNIHTETAALKQGMISPGAGETKVNERSP